MTEANITPFSGVAERQQNSRWWGFAAGGYFVLKPINGGYFPEITGFSVC